MALIEIYHVVADMLPTNPDFTTDIVEGECVRLAGDGTVTPCTVAGEIVYGVAGDTQSATQSARPYSDDIIMGANGALNRRTENRVSDLFNETGASGLCTVYTSGGKFATDQYATARADNLNPMTSVFTDANAQLTDVAGAGNRVGTVVASPAAYPSGVPGTDVDGSMALGTYLIFKLSV